MESTYRRLLAEQVRADALMSGLRMASENDYLMRVLCDLQSCIGDQLREFRENYEKTQDDYFVEDTAFYAEALVGAALVVAQAYQTGVICAAAAVHKQFPLPRWPRKSDEIRAKFLEVRKDAQDAAPYSFAQAINAFANYFKHAEEWHPRWCEDKPAEMNPTQRIVYEFGARSVSNLHLIHGLENLGYNLDKLGKVYNDLRLWAEEIIKLCEAALPGPNADNGTNADNGVSPRRPAKNSHVL